MDGETVKNRLQYVKWLKPTKQKKNKKRFFGFDIETYDNNKKFLMASIYSDTYCKTFYNPDDLITELKNNKIFHNSYIFATNLSFDFFGTFFTSNELANFKTLFRGSDLLTAKTYIYNNIFFPYPSIKRKRLPSIIFLDSCNYIKLSVEQMGKIIGVEKIKTPEFIGQKPRDKDEWREMIDYNIRDSRVTYEFMKFLIFSFEEMGATFKNTAASTSLALFKNKYLDNKYMVHDVETLLEQFEAYYGGRTESFCRGSIEDYNYYDFNSLYPSVMIDTDFPNPNTLRQNSLNTMHYINNYEGISYVNITCPDNIHYPVLPYRDDDKKKVVFPTGNITGWYCHNEIRYAVEQGYIVNEVYKTQYFTETCAPFKNFIEELYDKRLQYKSEGSKMELVAKLFMNSLYGKFAQKFLDMDNWQHEKTVTEKELQKSKHIERKGCFIRLVQDNKPSHFCIPIWSCYVTAKGRIKMHKAIKENNPVYCDTDSLITKNKLEESNKLGALKMEMKVKEGIIVKPKFYALISQEDEDYVKIKGLGRRISYLCFSDFVSKYNKSIKEYNELGVKIKGTKVFYDKFMKFKEALRRDFMPNEIQDISKEFSLEDDKRKWEKEFDYREFQVSRPIKIKS